MGMAGWVMTTDSDKYSSYWTMCHLNPNWYQFVEPSLLRLGQIGELQVLFQYLVHLSRRWVGIRPESNPSGTQSQQQASTQSVFPYLVSLQWHRVCLLYNCESTPGCSFPNCKFKHICHLCTDDPHSTDKHLNAVICPHHTIPLFKWWATQEKWYSSKFYNRPNPNYR